jgi:hypothetical protein
MFPEPFIGAWLQPKINDKVLADYGCNVKIGLELGGGEIPPATRQSFIASAALYGMKVIIPYQDSTVDLNSPTVIGWMHGDEPDQQNSSGVPGNVVQARTADWKRNDPSKFIFCNFDGNQVAGAVAGWNHYDYASAVKGLDIVSVDYHPCNWGKTDFVSYGAVLDYLRKLLTTGQRLVCLIEASDEALRNDSWWGQAAKENGWPLRRPAPGDIFTEWSIATTKADGYYYFFHRIGAKFEAYMDVSPEDATTVKQLNNYTKFKALAPVFADFGAKLSTLSKGL